MASRSEAVKRAEGPDEESGEVMLAPSVLSIIDWTVTEEEQRPLAIVLPGANHLDRRTVLRQYTEGAWRRFHPGVVIDAEDVKSTAWLEGNVADNLLHRLAILAMPPLDKEMFAPWYPHESAWELLWNLVGIKDIIINEHLREMVDQSFYLVHDVHRALWEARFIDRESNMGAVEDFMLHFTHWIMGEPLGEAGQKALAAIGIKRLVSSNAEKLDVFFFLLALGSHNGLLDRAIFTFDDLEHALQPNKRGALRQLKDVLDAGRRWAKFGGTPFGTIFGFTGSSRDLELMSKFHTKLAAEVSTGLEWARKSVS
jgi:hypothetical protein